MNRLHPDWGRLLLIQQLAVAATFEERDARLPRVALQVFQRKDERALDQAVDQQPVGLGINVGNAAMRTLEMHAVGRDHAVKQMMWRACRTGTGGSR